jgi:transketolase
MTDLDQINVNTIRFLAVDAVEKANSGHPGLPLGAAPMAYTVWDRFLAHDPTNPSWFNRGRFILSPGHGSAMLYALLHLYGYDLPLDEVRDFRQIGSLTPGHPEYGLTSGVEATTGPLGQGFSMGVGMAMAERFLAAHFNRPGFPIVDHTVYAIVSDGDLMEGVSSEAASLAGTLGLGKLIYLYDDNHISIEGETDIAFREDVERRLEAYGWHVVRVADGTDLTAIEDAVEAARQDERPSMIMVRSIIGFGSPLQGTARVHGEPLRPNGIEATKKALGWPTGSTFLIPAESADHFARSREEGHARYETWARLLDQYRIEDPELAAQLDEAIDGRAPAGWDSHIPSFNPSEGDVSTRDASGSVMNGIARGYPTFFGGSADLSPSTKTELVGFGDFGIDNASGRNIHFGIREHAMGAIINGLALHGGVLPFGSTFFVFADYLRPALRRSALMQTHVVYVFTHDSIAVGEDGPTHQPVEQLASLRTVPGITLLRPADANETAAAWRIAVERSGPTVIVLTRQKLPVLNTDRYPVIEGVELGGYVLREADGGSPQLILVATGSEVALALDAADRLAEGGIAARVVSLPSWELFREQSDQYHDSVLPPNIPRLAIEAAHSMGWHEFIGDRGEIISIDRFGASGPGPDVYADFGFTVDHVVDRATALAKVKALKTQEHDSTRGIHV